MAPIHVVGIGLSGPLGLTTATQILLQQATVLIGSQRHLNYFADHPAELVLLTDFSLGLAVIRQYLNQSPEALVVVLTSGDPLFFGFGRLLLQSFSADQLCFHPHLSSVQIAFNRLKVPWQDAQIVSVHGRSLAPLISSWQKGVAKIAILTDADNTPAAIAKLFLSLDLPINYEFWVCENLEGVDECIQKFAPESLLNRQFSPLNIVILLRQSQDEHDQRDLDTLPLLGISDRAFHTFIDRPGLMTKREIRIIALAELQLQKNQIIWDIGSGTGAVAIEIARLSPSSQIYAIEKTMAGTQLISQNCSHFKVDNVHIVQGQAPQSLDNLPQPHRIFIGGSGGYLQEILNYCQTRLSPRGIMVLSLTTLENFHLAGNWFHQQGWLTEHLQVQLSRSVPITTLTRLAPLNPVMLIKASKNGSHI